jgi:hypothetical protein
MIAVAKLTAHPANVREDLDLSAEFCASIAENGVRVPLLITTDGADGFRVIEGHRRLAAAVKAGLAEVPYDLYSERAADEAGQFLDMVTANSAAYRKNFTALEEATVISSRCAAVHDVHELGRTGAGCAVNAITLRRPSRDDWEAWCGCSVWCCRGRVPSRGRCWVMTVARWNRPSGSWPT